MHSVSLNDLQVTVVGGGVIGGGWVARFLLMGVDVTVFDPDIEAERKINEVVANAQRSLPGLYDHQLPNAGELRFADTLEDAVCNADWVCECVPEQLELKQNVFSEIQTCCSEQTIIASSTSGFRPSQLQAQSHRPAQIIVAHPFNPVYLIPLVELVGDAATVERASQLLEKIGMRPLHVKHEIDAHIADRLLEAVWREGLWLVNDGIATTQEIDDAIIYGFGLRWAQMGLFETYRIAGGEAGMAHFIKQFGPALEWPWTKLMDVPELSPELINTIAGQSDAQSGNHSIRELERIRDDNLVSMLRALKGQNWAAGRMLNDMDATLAPELNLDKSGLPISAKRVVPINWTDYNGHMNDSRYAQVFSQAGDAFMAALGADQAYVQSGLSYFTVDMHISYLHECHAGDAISVITKIIDGAGKKLRLQHVMCSADERVLASCDVLLIHVDLNTRKSCEPRADIAKTLAQAVSEHKAHVLPN